MVKENHQTDKMTLQQTDTSSVKTEVDQGKRDEPIFCQGTTASICLSVHPPVQPPPTLWCLFEQSLYSLALGSFKGTDAVRSFLVFVSALRRRGDMNIKYA